MHFYVHVDIRGVGGQELFSKKEMYTICACSRRGGGGDHTFANVSENVHVHIRGVGGSGHFPTYCMMSADYRKHCYNN